MNKFLQDYFLLSKVERTGLFLLLLLFATASIVPYIISNFFQDDINDVIQFEEIVVDRQFPTENQESFIEVEQSLFSFNPNTLSKEGFMRLGLSPKVAQTILNYREKGGSFKSPEDLKKIYGLESADYTRLKDYVQIIAIDYTDQPAIASYDPKSNSDYGGIPRQYDTYNAPTPTQKIENFPFDPNTATKEEFRRLGLNERVITTIINFRKRGAFRQASDFQKIFGLSKGDYERLLPYIQIKEKLGKERKNIAQEGIAPKKMIALDINTASQEEWEQLHGIGPYYAKKIINFREKLGGFSSIEQVGNTYKLPDSTFQSIQPNLKLSPIYRFLSINTASIDEMADHPYLSKKQAIVIEKYRKNHDPFQSVEAFERVGVFKEGQLDKLSPYLSFATN